MIAFTHLAVGAAGGSFVNSYLPEGKLIPKLAMGFAAGLVSHVVLDTFAHWEYQDAWPWLIVLVEAAVVFILVFSAGYRPLLNLVLFFGMSGAASPDLLTRIPVAPAPLITGIIHFSHDYLLSASPVSLEAQIFIGIFAILFVRYKT